MQKLMSDLVPQLLGKVVTGLVRFETVTGFGL